MHEHIQICEEEELNVHALYPIRPTMNMMMMMRINNDDDDDAMNTDNGNNGHDDED